MISDNGAEGSWGFSYNTAAGPGLPVTYGRLGELATLNFDVGGFDDTGFTFGYYTYVYLRGDWTTQGTGPGDYVYHSVAAGFSTPTFTYDLSSNTTTVFTYDLSFTGNGTGPALQFTLIGTVVPEPATWAMMLLGFASLSLAGWRASRKSIAFPGKIGVDPTPSESLSKNIGFLLATGTRPISGGRPPLCGRASGRHPTKVDDS